MAHLRLPKADKHLARALDDAIIAAETWMNISYVEWYISHHYLQGAREFSVSDYMAGDVSVSYEGSDDELQFRYEKVLQLYKTELSRYMKMDVSPRAETEGFGILDSVRDAGMANATLRYMIAGIAEEQKKSRFLQLWLKYGTACLLHYRGQGKNIRDRTRIDIVPPWEVLCTPPEVHNLDDVRMITRKRQVPLSWLTEDVGLKLPKDNAKLRAEEYEYGMVPNRYGALEIGGVGGHVAGSTAGSGFSSSDQRQGAAREEDYSSRGSRKGGKSKRPVESWVWLEENWTLFGNETVAEYIIKIGEHIAHREENGEEDQIILPIATARHIPTGRFYGRSFVGALVGFNDQIEHMLGRQFQMVSDMDEYPMVIVPATAGISHQELQKRERRKVVIAEPDPITPNYKPYEIKPTNAGDAPGKMASLGIQLLNDLSGQSELYQGGAPGRVDSASGLGFLFETGNISQVASSSEIADAYQQIYRHMLQSARREIEQDDDSQALYTPPSEIEGMEDLGMDMGVGMPDMAEMQGLMGGMQGEGLEGIGTLAGGGMPGGMGGEQSIPTTGPSFALPVIDDRMLGVKINDQGVIMLDENPIPHPMSVKIDIADRLPTSKQHTREECIRLLQMGQMTSIEFRILNYRENLGFPILNRSEWEAYRKATYKKILLFNDGKKPNMTIRLNTEADHPEVELMVCNELMNGVEFALASDDVRRVFEDWKMNLELMLGIRFPDQLPYPEDAAMILQQRGAQMPGSPAPQTAGSPQPQGRQGGGNGQGVPRPGG